MVQGILNSQTALDVISTNTTEPEPETTASTASTAPHQRQWSPAAPADAQHLTKMVHDSYMRLEKAVTTRTDPMSTAPVHEAEEQLFRWIRAARPDEFDHSTRLLIVRWIDMYHRCVPEARTEQELISQQLHEELNFELAWKWLDAADQKLDQKLDRDIAFAKFEVAQRFVPASPSAAHLTCPSPLI